MEGALLIPFPKPDLSITEKTKQENLHKIPLLSNKRLGLPCKILFRQPTQYLTALGDHSTPTIFFFSSIEYNTLHQTKIALEFLK